MNEKQGHYELADITWKKVEGKNGTYLIRKVPVKNPNGIPIEKEIGFGLGASSNGSWHIPKNIKNLKTSIGASPSRSDGALTPQDDERNNPLIDSLRNAKGSESPVIYAPCSSYNLEQIRDLGTTKPEPNPYLRFVVTLGKEGKDVYYNVYVKDRKVFGPKIRISQSGNDLEYLSSKVKKEVKGVLADYIGESKLDVLNSGKIDNQGFDELRSKIIKWYGGKKNINY